MNAKITKYDLEERTTEFGENVLDLCKKLSQNAITKPIISQLVRSSTSIGANYMEANGASSKKDFRNKIHTCKKESQETKYWLKMLLKCFPEKQKEIHVLSQETQEFVLIFGKITSSLRNDLNKSLNNSIEIKN